MAGAPSMAESRTQSSNMAVRDEWRWEVEYSRLFAYPSSYVSSISTAITSRFPLLKRALFRPAWISSSGSSTVSFHPSADESFSDCIITVTLEGTVIEEHFISKLHFTWPQVSCVSGFPPRGSRNVFVSYIDAANEKQKFGLRFSTFSETEDFITSLEDMFSNKIPKGLKTQNAISAISCESEPPQTYRPDMTNLMNPNDASPVQNYSPTEDCQETQDSHTQNEEVPDCESNVSGFPPRFTSLVSNCSSETQKDKLALALPSEPKENNLKSQIAKYIQDASFLDIVNKVNEVICELGEDFVL